MRNCGDYENQQIQVCCRLPVLQTALLAGSRAGTRGGAGCCRSEQSSSRGTRSACSPASCFRAASRLAATVVSIEAIRTTRELVANREVPAIFEGVFEHGGVLVRVDVLHRRRDGRWRLIEVKSTTDVKEHHLDDVGDPISRGVSLLGWTLASCCLAHVNRNYVFRAAESTCGGSSRSET